jgi:hypothetical protein
LKTWKILLESFRDGRKWYLSVLSRVSDPGLLVELRFSRFAPGLTARAVEWSRMMRRAPLVSTLLWDALSSGVRADFSISAGTAEASPLFMDTGATLLGSERAPLLSRLKNSAGGSLAVGYSFSHSGERYSLVHAAIREFAGSAGSV